MPKGMLTQGVCLLTDGSVTIEQVKQALKTHRVQVVKESAAAEEWAFGGPTVVVPFAPDVNGYAAIDVVNRPWPDAMGDPKKDAMVFGAWTMGQFGPYTFPGGLQRAQQHSVAWPGGRSMTHGRFIRLRTSYVFGAGDNAPILPPDYDPIAEMNFLDRLALAVFDVPGVICYFNPNGETLHDRASFRETFEGCAKGGFLALQLWSNVRLFNVNPTYTLMDTVGNGQIDVADVEAIFPTARYQPEQVAYYLRNVTVYLSGAGRELKTGEAIDGPNETGLSWLIEIAEQGITAPARYNVVRLYPKADAKAIKQALAAIR